MTTKKETKERKQSSVKIRFAHELKRTFIKRIEGKIVHLEYIYGDGKNELNELFKVESHGKYGSQRCAEIGGACALGDLFDDKDSDEISTSTGAKTHTKST